MSQGIQTKTPSLPKALVYTWGDGGNKAKKKKNLLLWNVPTCGSSGDDPSKTQRQNLSGLLQSTFVKQNSGLEHGIVSLLEGIFEQN